MHPLLTPEQRRILAEANAVVPPVLRALRPTLAEVARAIRELGPALTDIRTKGLTRHGR